MTGIDLVGVAEPDARQRLLAVHPTCSAAATWSNTDTIATLWSLALDHLRTAQPAVVQLATLCAYLAPEPIPLDLITGHTDQLPSPLREASADPAALADMIGVLLDYSLARRTNTGLLLHRLTQTVLRHTAPTEPSPLATALTLLRVDLPGDITNAPQNWPRWRRLLPHVLAAASLDDDRALVAADDSAWLLDHAVTPLRLDPCSNAPCASTRPATD